MVDSKAQKLNIGEITRNSEMLGLLLIILRLKRCASIQLICYRFL